MVAPNIAQDDRTTNVQGFYTLQNEEQENKDTTDAVSHDNTKNTTDTLCMLYAIAAKRQDMNFHNYCRHVCNLNTRQCHIVMYNRACCKSYINAVRHREKLKGIQNFSKWPRGYRQKSCCTSHSKRHVSLFQTHSET